MPLGYNPMRTPKVTSLVRLCALTALLAPLAAQAVTQTYTTVGSSTWTVPQGVTSLNVTATGGGGAGGRATGGGTGGAGGVVTNAAWTVVPGQTVAIVVGGPGTNVAGASGGGGGASSLNIGTNWIIAGGGGGGGGFGGSGTGGAGGSGCGGNGVAGGGAPAGGSGSGGGGGNGGVGGAGAGTGGQAGAKGGNGNGGSGGTGYALTTPANNGGLGVGAGQGGSGATFTDTSSYGGGGGGGGGFGGGGGGGSGAGTDGGGGGGGSTGGTCAPGSNGGARGASGTAGSVSFSYTAYTLGGTITGLTAGGLVLSAGTTPNQTVSPASGATAFTFANAFLGNYNVTVQTQPAGMVCTVTNGAGSISAANVSNVAVACKANQTITFGAQPGQTYVSGGTFNINPVATASSGLPVTYAVGPSTVCTMGSGTTVNIIGAGTCAITASQGGNANYNAATPVTQNVNVAKANQTITFGSQAGRTYAPGGTFAINPVATASSGLAVAYAVSPNTVCTMGSGTTVNIIGAGTCAITASQAGDGNYNAAASVTQNVVIAKAAQTLTFPAQTTPRPTFVDGGTFSINPLATSASPNSSNTITYSSLTPLVCTVSGTTVSMLKPGTCTLAADQAGNGNYLDAAQVRQDVMILPPPTAIPTLNQWGLMLMGLLAAGVGMRRLRRV